VAGVLGSSVEHLYRGLSFLERHAGRFRWTDMITSDRPLDEVNDALADTRSGTGIKPALTFG
jgi:Zn-dependent alcohol dehydrogenase